MDCTQLAQKGKNPRQNCWIGAQGSCSLGFSCNVGPIGILGGSESKFTLEIYTQEMNASCRCPNEKRHHSKITQ